LFCAIQRAKGPGVARRIAADIAQLPIELVDAGYELTKLAAELHANHKLPYADFAKLDRRLTLLWTR
jgi:hypothetical protein